MKIYYFTKFDVLRARTNQISDMRFCEGFAENGCDVTFITPYVYRKDNIKKNRVFEYYGITKPFDIQYLKTVFTDKFPDKLVLPFLFISSFLFTSKILLKNIILPSKVIILSRHVDLLIPSLFLKKVFKLSNIKVISWVHEVIDKNRYRWVYQNADGVMGTNSAIVDDLNKFYKIPREKLAVTLNPITDTQLKKNITKNSARNYLQIKDGKPIIVYTGKLYIGQKEADCILEAAKRLTPYQFILTGGKPEVVGYYTEYCNQNNIQNVLFSGFLHNYSEIIYYQYCADVLISYYTSQDHMVRYNFPQKIIEYMLTGNPIVTPDFPATRDVLHAQNAIFVEPENVNSLVQGIHRAVEDKEHVAGIRQRLQQEVPELTFKRRTKMLIDFIKTL